MFVLASALLSNSKANANVDICYSAVVGYSFVLWVSCCCNCWCQQMHLFGLSKTLLLQLRCNRTCCSRAWPVMNDSATGNRRCLCLAQPCWAAADTMSGPLMATATIEMRSAPEISTDMCIRRVVGMTWETSVWRVNLFLYGMGYSIL
jgi:hypothetical protein